MNWTKLSLATSLAAALIVSPATAYADPVPTADEVVAAMAELTNPAANKNNTSSRPHSPPKKPRQSTII